MAEQKNKIETKGLTLIEAIRQGIWEEMARDETVFVIGEDVGEYGGAFKLTEGFVDEFGTERMIDTPISEAEIVGVACGAGRQRFINHHFRRTGFECS